MKAFRTGKKCDIPFFKSWDVVCSRAQEGPVRLQQKRVRSATD